MKTIKITPRGYCHGVVNAINTISNLSDLSIKKPVYILGMVIHNKQMTASLEQKGFITLHDPSKTRLELLDSIDEGTVIFTAHGVSPAVYEKAIEKGLEIIDTTCDDVIKSQITIKEYLAKGYDVIYIGKHNHPESEAVSGISSQIHVVEDQSDFNKLDIHNPNIVITNQTTMSIYDVFTCSEFAKRKYPNIVYIDEICDATRIRQEAVAALDSSVDHVIVVGDKLSNNSRKLAEVSIQKAKIPATLIENIEDIDIDLLQTIDCVAVTSGASTPTKVTNEVISFLENFDKNNPSTHNITTKINLDNLLTKKHF
ncbi:MAG: 4-hydroxy-3-methylbut-2-enyl diphosphate reductase [Bacilli bacterium]|nr:4-hydroxy-3-methylbut-2-enyl diphosphate reductase [Bacilli bacterium]